MTKFRDEADDYALLYVMETPAAYGVQDDEDAELIWLPKSQVEVDGPLVRGKATLFTVPNWLAEQKGLI